MQFAVQYLNSLWDYLWSFKKLCIYDKISEFYKWILQTILRMMAIVLYLNYMQIYK